MGYLQRDWKFGRIKDNGFEAILRGEMGSCYPNASFILLNSKLFLNHDALAKLRIETYELHREQCFYKQFENITLANMQCLFF
jgi:hypothetical protein